MHDGRRITVPAPEPGERQAPPPRRSPTVVPPPSGPAPSGPAPSEPDPAVAGPSSPAGDAPATASPAASPRPGGTGRAAPSQPRRVVVPAPGAAGRSAPPASPAPARPGGRDRGSPPRPPAPSPASGWRRYLPSKRVVLAVLVVLVLLAAGTLLWAKAKFDSIETVELSSVLAEGNGTNYLIVGSDTREGVDPNDPNAGAILGDDTVGSPERSDTILILRVDDQGSRMLSVPRDLYLTISETGQRSRINSAFNGGPSRLVATLTDQLDLPVHHYLEVDFVSFAGVVDALGGITIDFPNPAFDDRSGLNVPEAGPQTLNGTQALAYVRSRYYTEIVDGQEVRDPTGDLGRTERQQQFLAAVTDAIGSERNPLVLRKVANELADGMRIDDDLGFLDALRLLRRMRGLDPAPSSLPTTNFQTSAGAAVLRLVQPDADTVLADFGSGGSRITG